MCAGLLVEKETGLRQGQLFNVSSQGRDLMELNQVFPGNLARSHRLLGQEEKQS